jgi:multicomponent Na+:H+ antiporter subunit D
MNEISGLTMLWIALPFLMGFGIYLLPQTDRVLSISLTICSGIYALGILQMPEPLSLSLLDNFGVTLLVDNLSAFFILTNALVSTAVIIYSWHTSKTAFFYTQLAILHGSLNSAFICADFVSLYVALEVIGIAAFLLIAYPRQNRSLWVALRYLFISNTAMLFYLIGAILIYQAHQSFAFAGLANAPLEAKALILIGLLVKGGIFVSGLWLPFTHAEAESPVSALLSGVVVKAGVFPLVRCALMVDDWALVLGWLGVVAALLGVLYGLFEQDSKRVLACSTLSQAGWILAAPAAAGPYALAHGVAKAALFLGVGNLPSRHLPTLRRRAIDPSLWVPILLGSLSISGFPLLLGFSSKMLTLKVASSWQTWVLNLAAVGTAVLYANFIFLSCRQDSESKLALAKNPGLKLALGLLIAVLIILNWVYLPQTFSGFNTLKATILMVTGWLLWWQGVSRIQWLFPKVMEQFEHLIGGMVVMLVAVLFITIVWTNTALGAPLWRVFS